MAEGISKKWIFWHRLNWSLTRFPSASLIGLMDRLLLPLRYFRQVASTAVWFLVQTLIVWVLITVTPIVRFAANVAGLLFVFGLAGCCIAAIPDSGLDWNWPHFHLLVVAVGLRALYEICARGLTVFLPEGQSVIL